LKRYDELDSLRGLAALTVMIGHCFMLLTFFNEGHSLFLGILKNSPLSIIWAGHQAVIMFFILSGFVLSLPYYFGRQQAYSSYIIRRICRIYLPYIFTIVLAIVARLLVTKQYNLDLDKWLYMLWDEEVTLSSILNHLTFVGVYNSRVFDPVVWSLIEEMRISIIFPLIMLLVLRFNLKINVAICLFCSVISNALFYIKWHYSFPALPTILGILSTIEWIPMFIIGALLAKNIGPLVKKFQQQSIFFKIVISVVGLLSYTYINWVKSDGSILHQPIVDNWFVILGASIFIVLSLSSKITSKLLMLRPIHFIGRISYSFYLLHMVILLTLVHALYGTIPLWAIWLLTLTGTLILSSFTYNIIEVTCIKLGRKVNTVLDGRIDRKIEV